MMKKIAALMVLTGSVMLAQDPPAPLVPPVDPVDPLENAGRLVF